MKFLETANATYVNMDEIVNIHHEWDDKSDNVYSYVQLSNGEKLDFLDVPRSFVAQDGVEYKISSDHLISWHRHAINLMLTSNESVVLNESLCDVSWELFAKEFEESKKIGCNTDV